MTVPGRTGSSKETQTPAKKRQWNWPFSRASYHKVQYASEDEIELAESRRGRLIFLELPLTHRTCLDSLGIQ